MIRALKTSLMILALAVLTTTGITAKAAALGTHRVTDNLCGSNYAWVGIIPLQNKEKKMLGEIDVYWVQRSGKKCAVTQSAGIYRGINKLMSVVICLEKCDGQHPEDKDYDYHTEYAGPVYMDAKDQCIEVAGLFNTANGPLRDPYEGKATGWCG